MDQLEEIKSKIDLVAYISETVPLKKAGRNFKGLCPFHAEKTPSFMVSQERQIWKCFGCQKGGDAFGFLMEIERVEFGEALRILAKRTGVILQSYRPTKSEEDKDKLYQINHLATEFFHYLLLNHPIGKRALDYILQRGISKDSLKLFKLGYSTPTWDGLQKYMFGKKGYSLEDLERAGLVISRAGEPGPTSSSNAGLRGAGSRRAGGYYDRFRDRLMFPLYDHRGNVTGFSGRVLDPLIKEAKYVNSPETLIYHKSELLFPLNITKEDIKKENQAIVVEGELDAISSYQVGLKNVVAIKGSALTEEQSRLLKRFSENVVLSLDSDAAGDMASRRGIEIADKLGLNLKVLTLEKYKDPDEAAQKEPGYLKQRLTEAVNIYDFFIDSAFKRFRGTTPEEKKKIGQEIVPVLSKIEDEIVKNVYTQKLAKKLGVNEEAIILQTEKVKDKTPFKKEIQPVTVQKLRREVLEEYLLALIFQSKNTEILSVSETKGLFTSLIYQKLIEKFEEYIKEKGKFSSQFFFNFLPIELRESFDRLFLIDFGDQLENSDWVKKELNKIQKQLKFVTVREELVKNLEILRQEEKTENGASFQIQAKIKELAQKLGEIEKET